MSKKTAPPLRTVTILTVTQIHRRGDTSTLTLAFASRDSALDAIRLHTSNPDEVTTVNIRTLRVIADE